MKQNSRSFKFVASSILPQYIYHDFARKFQSSAPFKVVFAKRKQRAKKNKENTQNPSELIIFNQVECRRTPVLYAFRVQFQDGKKKRERQ